LILTRIILILLINLEISCSENEMRCGTCPDRQ
jgi:hypothetical protein